MNDEADYANVGSFAVFSEGHQRYVYVYIGATMLPSLSVFIQHDGRPTLTRGDGR